MPESMSPDVSVEPSLDVHAVTDVGKVRGQNQDAFLLASIRGAGTHGRGVATVAIVADGVGGGVGGADASATAVSAAMAYMDGLAPVLEAAPRDGRDLTPALQEAALAAHAAVRAKREAAGIRGTMATTLTMLVDLPPAPYLVQVGDSRCYRWRDGTLTQVTRDQTLAQDLLDSGALSVTGAMRTPLAHVLSSAIGADRTAPAVTRLDAAAGDAYLLCSDGLTKHVADERIAEVMAAIPDPRAACARLLEEALAGGGSDNVTIVIGRAARDAGA